MKSLAGVLDVIQALLTTAKCIFSRLVKYASISSHRQVVFLAELIKIALKGKALFYLFIYTKFLLKFIRK
jgi:hypothetical protein